MFFNNIFEMTISDIINKVQSSLSLTFLTPKLSKHSTVSSEALTTVTIYRKQTGTEIKLFSVSRVSKFNFFIESRKHYLPFTFHWSNIKDWEDMRHFFNIYTSIVHAERWKPTSKFLDIFTNLTWLTDWPANKETYR